MKRYVITFDEDEERDLFAFVDCNTMDVSEVEENDVVYADGVRIEFLPKIISVKEYIEAIDEASEPLPKYLHVPGANMKNLNA